MRKMGGGERYESSPKLGCARLKRQKLRGTDWVLRQRKTNELLFQSNCPDGEGGSVTELGGWRRSKPVNHSHFL